MVVDTTAIAIQVHSSPYAQRTVPISGVGDAQGFHSLPASLTKNSIGRRYLLALCSLGILAPTHKKSNRSVPKTESHYQQHYISDQTKANANSPMKPAIM